MDKKEFKAFCQKEFKARGFKKKKMRFIERDMIFYAKLICRNPILATSIILTTVII